MTSLQVLASRAGEGRAFWFLDALSIIRWSGQQTDGAFALIEERMPAGRSSPYHMHRNEDETFYVLEGELTFFTGSEKIRGGPGASVFLPRQIPHGFRADTSARILVLVTPPGFEEFVAEAGEPAPKLELPAPQTPDIARLTECAAKYGIEILGLLPQ
jgi:quercetin dioxygenase-like cupin family protein